jgi:hypothetical protein
MNQDAARSWASGAWIPGGPESPPRLPGVAAVLTVHVAVAVPLHEYPARPPTTRLRQVISGTPVTRRPAPLLSTSVEASTPILQRKRLDTAKPGPILAEHLTETQIGL